MNVGRLYAASWNATLAASAADLIQVEAASANPCFLERIHARMKTTTEAMLRWRIRRATDAIGAGDVTPNPLNVGDVAFHGVVVKNDATQLVTGAVDLWDDYFNAIEPLVWFPPPEHRIFIEPGNLVTVSLDTAPEAVNMSFTAILREFG